MFWECVTVGMFIVTLLVIAGLVLIAFVLGQIVYWPCRWLGWVNDWEWGEHAPVFSACSSGSLLVLAALIDIAYCLICPSCGGLF